MKKLLYIMSALLLLCSCYHGKSKASDATPADSIDSYTLQKNALDSVSFYSNHHYTTNFNFVVSEDSLVFFKQQPEELLNHCDTQKISIKKNQDLVVADIRIIQKDSIDSVWVELAHDQNTIGWIHETDMLHSVTPNDPISKFISTFSDIHILLTLIVFTIIAVAYLIFIMLKHKARIVHVNDIPSFYPTALLLAIALAATFYSSIQLFAPEIWKHYYYHPTLNPLSVPPLLAIFLTLVWLLPIAAIAAVDDAFHHLKFGEAILYCCGLGALCLVVYIIFSVSTLYYLGYPLMVAYMAYSIISFVRHRRLVYFCGKCGKALTHKGKCPYCGAENI